MSTGANSPQLFVGIDFTLSHYGDCNPDTDGGQGGISRPQPSVPQWHHAIALTMPTLVLGGNQRDRRNGIAVDAADNTLVTDYTFSSSWISGGYDTTSGGENDGYVVKLSPIGQHIWSTYLGGNEKDSGHQIAVRAESGRIRHPHYRGVLRRKWTNLASSWDESALVFA